MESIISASRLAFFKAEQYEYKSYNTFDTSACPRPHFCMGLVLSGKGFYTDCESGDVIEVTPGDIIFVPMGSRYISQWHGSPEISYISMHFIFDGPGIFSQQKNYILQKAHPVDFEKTKTDFLYVLDNYNKEETAQLCTLGKFFGILGEIFPSLKRKSAGTIDSRMEKAIEYIEKNYSTPISVDILAGFSNMSVSRFFPAFKKAFGVTPIEYVNSYRIRRAIILMLNNPEISIERISEDTGFDSSAYFRRVFKKATGKSPRDYRKTAMEM